MLQRGFAQEHRKQSIYSCLITTTYYNTRRANNFFSKCVEVKIYGNESDTLKSHSSRNLEQIISSEYFL